MAMSIRALAAGALEMTIGRVKRSLEFRTGV